MAKFDVEAAYRNIAAHPDDRFLLGMRWRGQFYVDLAAKVVWPGRTFLRRMIDLLCCFRKKDHPIRLNRDFQLDLQWWHQFLSSWNGVGFWLFPGMTATTNLKVTSDAAGSIGFGAYFYGQWFYGPYAPSQAQQSIAYKELFPVVIAAHLWGHLWTKRHVLFRSDNEAVVAILTSRTSKVPALMRLLRDLLLPAAQFNFTLLLSTFQGSRIKLLTLSHAFIGRNSGGLFQRLSPPHARFLNFSWTA